MTSYNTRITSLVELWAKCSEDLARIESEERLNHDPPVNVPPELDLDCHEDVSGHSVDDVLDANENDSSAKPSTSGADKDMAPTNLSPANTLCAISDVDANCQEAMSKLSIGDGVDAKSDFLPTKDDPSLEDYHLYQDCDLTEAEIRLSRFYSLCSRIFTSFTYRTDGDETTSAKHDTTSDEETLESQKDSEIGNESASKDTIANDDTKMMFVSGETAEPSPETTTLIEEITRQQVIEIVRTNNYRLKVLFY